MKNGGWKIRKTTFLLGFGNFSGVMFDFGSDAPNETKDLLLNVFDHIFNNPSNTIKYRPSGHIRISLLGKFGQSSTQQKVAGWAGDLGSQEGSDKDK